MIILGEVAGNKSDSLTRILHRISAEKRIPLSTLKFNSKTLIQLGLIESIGWNGRRRVRLTELGYKVLRVLNRDESSRLVEPEVISNDIKSVNENLREVLLMIDGFHSFSSNTSVNIIYSIFRYRLLTNKDIRRTKLILSKGHAAPALYAVLKHFNILSDDDFKDAFTARSNIQSHPIRGCPTVMVSTGSLGQGLSIANGISIAMRSDGDLDDVYVLMGDGELDEGQFWEALSTTSSLKLDNIFLIIDRNWYQLTGYTEEVKVKEPLEDRLLSFGWVVERVKNSVPEIISSLFRLSETGVFPKALIVDTASGNS